MKLFRKAKAALAGILALVMMVTMMPDMSAGKAVAAADTYSLAVFTTTTNFYASTGNVDQETQSVYFAVSKNGKQYEVLNNGGGVVFASLGSFKIAQPRILKEGNQFKIYAMDSTSSNGVHIFKSSNGVVFTDEELSTQAGDIAVVSDTPALDAASVSGFPEDANLTLGNAVELTATEYKYITNKLGTVVNTGLEKVKTLSTTAGKAITQQQLAKEIPSVNATYSDGSKQKFNIDWTNALKSVDFTKPGTYNITGNVEQTQYTNKLQELNGSMLPEDDPYRANSDFPSNYDPDTKEVYYDSTKYVEGMADPEIYWDEVTGYYYMTGSYFPSKEEEANGNQQYDRVTLRRSETLEGLQDRSGQVTVWKVGNQPWYNGENDATGSRGYRYIWAPEIHRIGYESPEKPGYWVVYFTESQSSGLFDIYSHCLVLDGSLDPYETPIESETGVSQWKDYKMQPWSEDNMSGDHYKSANNSGITKPAFVENFCLDMTYFKDEVSGENYVIWAGKPTKAEKGGNTDLFIAKVNPEKPWELTSSYSRLTWSQFGWERVRFCVNEGATVLQKDGKIFMAFSVSGTGSEYAIGLMTVDAGKDLLDLSNWKKNPYPLLTSRDVDGEEGPGHNSFTVDEDGNAIFVYHARPTTHNYKMCGYDPETGKSSYNTEPLNDPCRHARLKRVHWASDGTPILKMTYAEELLPTYTKVKTTIQVKQNIINPTSVAVNPKSKTMNVGSSTTLRATVAPSNATNKKVTWSSSRSSVASVSTAGKVKAKAIGSARITAKSFNGKSAYCTITVKAPVTKLKFKATKYKLKPGKTLKLKDKLTVTPKKTTDKLKFTSSKKKIATVTSTGGVVKAKKVGTTKITVKATSGKKVSCTIIVKK